MPPKLRTSVSVKGVAEAQAAFRGVKAGVQNRVLKQALRKVATVANKAAKAGAPKGSGLLRRSVGVKSYGKASKGRFGYVVGPRTRMAAVVNGRQADPAKYAHLVEGGRKEVRPTKRRVMANKAAGVFYGTRAKAVAARPFMKPAADRARAEATGGLPGAVAAGIAREAAKYAGKGKTIYLR